MSGMRDFREILARLGVQSVLSINGGGGGRPALEGAEVAGLLRGLEDEARDLALLQYCGDESCRPAVFYTAYVRVAGIAAAEGWQLPKRGEDGKLALILRRMTAAALFELVEMPVCWECDGVGWVGVKQCPECHGLLRVRMPAKHVAQALGRSRQQFYEVWKPRYETVYNDLSRWINGLESDLIISLRKNVRGY